MALYLLFDAWRFFVSIHSLIVFVETQALDLHIHAIVLFFDTMIFCRIMVLVATTLGHKSRTSLEMSGKSKGEAKERMGRDIVIKNIQRASGYGNE